MHYSGSYYPSSIPGGDICPFSDTVTATTDLPNNSSGTNCDPLDGQCIATSTQETCNLRAVDTDNDCKTGPVSP